MMNILEIAFKLVLAMVVGGLVGAEREFHDKTAGFRTITFICVGATLFTILSLELGRELNDSLRIAAGIVTGVGFIGAGVIIRHGEHIKGLTTASTIWVVAALGMGIGSGYYLIVGIAGFVIMIGLWIFPLVDRVIHQARMTRSYNIVITNDLDEFNKLKNVILNSGLQIENCSRKIQNTDMVCTWLVHGSPKNHEQLIDQLLLDKELKELQY